MKATENFHVKFKHDTLKGMTFVEIIHTEHPLPLVESFAVKSLKDHNYNRKVGREVSFLRALDTALDQAKVDQGVVRRVLTRHETIELLTWFNTKFGMKSFNYYKELAKFVRVWDVVMGQ